MLRDTARRDKDQVVLRRARREAFSQPKVGSEPKAQRKEIIEKFFSERKDKEMPGNKDDLFSAGYANEDLGEEYDMLMVDQLWLWVLGGERCNPLGTGQLLSLRPRYRDHELSTGYATARWKN